MNQSFKKTQNKDKDLDFSLNSENLLKLNNISSDYSEDQDSNPHFEKIWPSIKEVINNNE